MTPREQEKIFNHLHALLMVIEPTVKVLRTVPLRKRNSLFNNLLLHLQYIRPLAVEGVKQLGTEKETPR